MGAPFKRGNKRLNVGDKQVVEVGRVTVFIGGRGFGRLFVVDNGTQVRNCGVTFATTVPPLAFRFTGFGHERNLTVVNGYKVTFFSGFKGYSFHLNIGRFFMYTFAIFGFHKVFGHRVRFTLTGKREGHATLTGTGRAFFTRRKSTISTRGLQHNNLYHLGAFFYHGGFEHVLGRREVSPLYTGGAQNKGMRLTTLLGSRVCIFGLFSFGEVASFIVPRGRTTRNSLPFRSWSRGWFCAFSPSGTGEVGLPPRLPRRKRVSGHFQFLLLSTLHLEFKF